jgi:hypothetical protein
MSEIAGQASKQPNPHDEIVEEAGDGQRRTPAARTRSAAPPLSGTGAARERLLQGPTLLPGSVMVVLPTRVPLSRHSDSPSAPTARGVHATSISI